MKILLWASRILGVLVIVATAIPLFSGQAWWIRAFDFPRLQFGLLGAIALIGLFSLKPNTTADWVLTGLLIVAVGYQSLRIMPYTPLWAKQVQDAKQGEVQDSISILIANVLMTNRDHEGLRKIVEDKDPDLILGLEVDDWWNEKIGAFAATYQHRVLAPLPNTYGMVLYSKLELADAQVKMLFEDSVPSIHTTVKLPTGRTITLRCVHPKPPAPQEAKSTVKRDAELLMVGKEVKPMKTPVIVMGDLNDVAWSQTTELFQQTSGLLDPRRGRGLMSTFDARNILMRWPLDHVFHSKHFELLEMKRMPKFNSDHFAVFVKLAITPDAQHEQEAPIADPEEQQDAQEKIEKGKSE